MESHAKPSSHRQATRRTVSLPEARRRRVLREGGLEHERPSARSCRPGREEQRLRAAVGRHYHLGTDAEIAGQGLAQPRIFQIGVVARIVVEGSPGGLQGAWRRAGFMFWLKSSSSPTRTSRDRDTRSPCPRDDGRPGAVPSP